MLLNAVMDLRARGEEWRSVHLYGQEVNLLTSCNRPYEYVPARYWRVWCAAWWYFGWSQSLLKQSAQSSLMWFLPTHRTPLKMESWQVCCRSVWSEIFMIVPTTRGCADYAFYTHIIKSLKPDTGRAAMLWPTRCTVPWFLSRPFVNNWLNRTLLKRWLVWDQICFITRRWNLVWGGA